MSQYIPLSRAARLVGTSRNILQKKIRAGELSTFEGSIKLDELLRVYPQTELEDSTMLEKTRHIIDYALVKLTEQSIQIPDSETLLTRVSRLSSELALSNAKLEQKTNLLEQIKQQLDHLASHDQNGRFDLFYHWFQNALQTQPHHQYSELAVKNTLLKIIAAEIKLLPSQHEFLLEGSDTLLESALRSGYNVAYGCNDGHCGRCKARIISGQAKQTRYLDNPLPAIEKSNDIIYLCSHTAVSDLTLEVTEIDQSHHIPKQSIELQLKQQQSPNPHIIIADFFSNNHMRLQYLAGQHVTLSTTNIESTHAIASCPCEERYLQFHIPTDSSLGQYITQAEHPHITLENPVGHFILNDTDCTQPLVLIAHETGFAPIKSLIQHALALDIPESIDFYWIADSHDGHYEHNLCRTWHDALDNFNYTPIIGQITQPDLLNQVIHIHPDLSQTIVYIAGTHDNVQTIQTLISQYTPAKIHTESII